MDDFLYGPESLMDFMVESALEALALGIGVILCGFLVYWAIWYLFGETENDE